jgi:hypothetical protein
MEGEAVVPNPEINVRDARLGSPAGIDAESRCLLFLRGQLLERKP